MAKKTGLGKGLDALFSSPMMEEKVDTEEVVEQVKYLKINEIEPNKEQARKIFDEEAIEELSNSIKEYGVIQPIVVAKKENYYEIIAGERRWRASKKAGLEKIPVIIKDDNVQRNKEISLIENIQREDLNPIEKARGIKQLMDEYSFTQETVADRIGKSRPLVANTLRLLTLTCFSVYCLTIAGIVLRPAINEALNLRSPAIIVYLLFFSWLTIIG